MIWFLNLKILKNTSTRLNNRGISWYNTMLLNIAYRNHNAVEDSLVSIEFEVLLKKTSLLNSYTLALTEANVYWILLFFSH